MLSLLNRYIARQYLFNVLVLLVVLFTFVIAVDVAVNLDRIWKQAIEVAVIEGIENPSTMQLLVLSTTNAFDLWWPRSLQLFNFMNGIVLAGAMGFTASQLVRHRELVAVLASGQSLRTVLRPILLVALLFGGLQIANRELVMPRVAHLLTRDHGDAGLHDLGSARLPLTSDGRDRLLYARSFDADDRVLEGLYVWVRDESGRAVERITAERATWQDGAWSLTGGVATPTSPGAPTTTRPIERFETDLDPTAIQMLRHRREIGQNLSWSQISTMLERRKMMDQERREELIRLKYGRFSTLLTQLLVLTISAPFFITRTPVPFLTQALKGGPIAIGGMLGGVLVVSMPIPGMPALVSVALPVVVLAPLAIAAVSAMRT